MVGGPLPGPSTIPYRITRFILIECILIIGSASIIGFSDFFIVFFSLPEVLVSCLVPTMTAHILGRG